VVVLWGGGEVSYHCVFIIIMYYYLARSEQDNDWKFQQTNNRRLHLTSQYLITTWEVERSQT
jgi:hypothetical protein